MLQHSQGWAQAQSAIFVVGMKEDMVRNWMPEPSLVRRGASFLAGAIAMAFVLSIAQALP